MKFSMGKRCWRNRMEKRVKEQASKLEALQAIVMEQRAQLKKLAESLMFPPKQRSNISEVREAPIKVVVAPHANAPKCSPKLEHKEPVDPAPPSNSATAEKPKAVQISNAALRIPKPEMTVTSETDARRPVLVVRKKTRVNNKPGSINAGEHQLERKTTSASTALNLEPHTKQPESNEFKCTVWPRLLSLKSNLASPRKSQTGKNSFFCDACRKRFYRIDRFNDHMRIHMSAKSVVRILNGRVSRVT